MLRLIHPANKRSPPSSQPILNDLSKMQDENQKLYINITQVYQASSAPIGSSSFPPITNKRCARLINLNLSSLMPGTPHHWPDDCTLQACPRMKSTHPIQSFNVQVLQIPWSTRMLCLSVQCACNNSSLPLCAINPHTLYPCIYLCCVNAMKEEPIPKFVLTYQIPPSLPSTVSFVSCSPNCPSIDPAIAPSCAHRCS